MFDQMFLLKALLSKFDMEHIRGGSFPAAVILKNDYSYSVLDGFIDCYYCLLPKGGLLDSPKKPMTARPYDCGKFWS